MQNQDELPADSRCRDKFSRVSLLGVYFDSVTESECVERISTELDRGQGGWVVTPNLDILRQCVQSPSLGRMVRGADIVVPDGMPLVWASRLQRSPLRQRVAGSDLISSLSAAAAERDRSVFLLGGAEGTASEAAARLRQGHDSLRIAGTYCPPHGFEADEALLQTIADMITEASPDIVFVGLGFPKQERLIHYLRPRLPKTWWLGVGISFSFLAGRVRRAPRWMQVMGLEWVHRLWQEPKRLFRRYIIQDVPFVFRLFGGALKARYWPSAADVPDDDGLPPV